MLRPVVSALLLGVALTAVAASSAQAQDYTPVSAPAIQAPLYPSPRPDIPAEVGWTVISNQALAPHEMLYAHSYRAIYPPYYYKNLHGLSCLPFFPKPALLGTEVRVKYHSHYKFGAGLPYLPTKNHYHNNQVHTWYGRSGWNH
ncbi:MAG: hypothetical protein ACK5HA_12310 [Planctomycetaceae bacterium]|jgi:hypothetical protein